MRTERYRASCGVELRNKRANKAASTAYSAMKKAAKLIPNVRTSSPNTLIIATQYAAKKSALTMNAETITLVTATGFTRCV